MTVPTEREQEYLFPGEHPDGFESTAQMWIAVYTDMLRLIRNVLMEDAGAGEIALRRKQRQFRTRLRFWESEARRLHGGSGR